MRKNPHAVALGRKGGKKGGRARAAKMTAHERSESARQAVSARWKRAAAQSTLRHPPRIEGTATIKAHPANTEIGAIHRVRFKSLDPFEMTVEHFFSPMSFAQLVEQQRIRPLQDASSLAGALPDDFDVDGMLDEIYRQRVQGRER